MADPRSEKRDLVLAEGEFAFLQDQTQGDIKICTGPVTVTPSQSDVPVVFEDKKNTFQPVANAEDAKKPNAFASEGNYIVLKNPHAKGERPKPGSKGSKVDYDALDVGSKVVIPGPVYFSLWPRQSAEVIEGHHLRSNQYLLVRIYNDEKAKANWAKAVVKKTAPTTAPPGGVDQPPPTPEELAAKAEQAAKAAQATVTAEAPVDLTMGKLLIVKGTEVSFYIPPTGVEVLAGEDGKYVREALTLERMEYCILVDEDGNKRYEKGPQVVFPEPTENFQQKDGHKKQKAIELNELQGLHLKAIADCEDTDIEVSFKQGEEYFITGKGTYDSKDTLLGPGKTIFYPREELAFVKYDGKTKIFAVTVPEGEGRYLMNRLTGEIETIKGPKQLLPNPILFVIVRRALSDKQCLLWFPGNMEALAYNQGVRAAAQGTPTTRAGTLSEGDFERATKGLLSSKRPSPERSVMMASVTNYAGETSRVSGDQTAMGDEFERQSGFTSPRTLTLNTKYQGAVAIRVWTGYAVQVVSKTGKRRVEIGPTNLLLDYDEELEGLSFSTGKPKTTENLIQDVYLRVENNKVSDKVMVETSDHVLVEAYLSYKVNFRGTSLTWFNSDNPVKLLCDHVRSLLKGAVRKIAVEDFYSNSTDIIRDVVLGKKDAGNGTRFGLAFNENGMQVGDVEVLGVTITDPAVQALLRDSQLKVVRTNVELANADRDLLVTKRKELIAQQQAQVKSDTQQALNELEVELNKSKLEVEITKINCALDEIQARKTQETESQALLDLVAEKEQAREKSAAAQTLSINQGVQALRLEALREEAKAVIEKLTAFKDGYGEILSAMQDKELMIKLAEAQNILRIIDGNEKADALVNGVLGLRNLRDLIAKAAANGTNGASKVIQTSAASPTP